MSGMREALRMHFTQYPRDEHFGAFRVVAAPIIHMQHGEVRYTVRVFCGARCVFLTPYYRSSAYAWAHARYFACNAMLDSSGGADCNATDA